MKNNQINLEPSLKNTQATRKEVISLKARAMAKRAWLEIIADWLANSFGTVSFLLLNGAIFLAWLLYNSSVMEGIVPFDPFPFNLLTTVVSLEAIFLAIIVLISQNRAAKIDQLRQEIDLQLDLISEQEITKIMEMLKKIMEHQHLNISRDATLREMLKPTDAQDIESELEKQM